MTSSQGKPRRSDPRLRACCSLSVMLIGCVLVSGCGGPGYEVAPVSGRITLNGKPIAEIHVSFQPSQEGNSEPGPGSFGKTDAEGRYSLQTVAEPPRDGAVVGSHVVMLRVSVPESANTDEVVAPALMLPVEAVDGSLSCEVPPKGTDQANFNLKAE